MNKRSARRTAPSRQRKRANGVEEMKAKLAAIDRVQGRIEFALDGTILDANDNFLRIVGYQLDELVGQHHRMFVEPREAASMDYARFWQRLNEGVAEIAEFKRIGKGGREVWILASYNPLLNARGKPYKVVKFATDLTEQKLQQANFQGQITAIDKSQAVIEFGLDGTILRANDNFLNALGYRSSEVQGRQHRMFVEPKYAESAEYREFWQRLNAGEYQAGEYKRIGKDGREVWIQASYNPILDLNGKPFKVVKFATDITQQKQAFRRLSEVIEALSRGDLTVSMQGKFEGDNALVQEKLNSTVSSLAALVARINVAVEHVSSAAGDIAEGNANLNTRTQEQSSTLEETASSLEELTATVKQNAQSATSANQLATRARAAAEKGGEVVGSAVGAMSAITEASKKVADIITVIEQIAFQTNMLALNAAVEAARAGDQGRGFAVVASEVRTLAQRSASAAKEIKSLILDSHDKVAEGANLVNRSGEHLSEIVAAVKTVSDIIREIDTASEQQAAGIDQINDAVAQLDKNTQQNAAMVEEATAAAESLSEQAAAMSDLVRFFTIPDDAGLVLGEPARAPASPPRRPARDASARRN